MLIQFSGKEVQKKCICEILENANREKWKWCEQKTTLYLPSSDVFSSTTIRKSTVSNLYNSVSEIIRCIGFIFTVLAMKVPTPFSPQAIWASQ
jgi:hypothetical protein